MKILILLKDHSDECRTWSVEDEDDARYQFLRRIEKEDFHADRAYLVEGEGLPLKEWFEAHERKQERQEAQLRAQQEKAEYERLKKKFEGKSANNPPTE